MQNLTCFLIVIFVHFIDRVVPQALCTRYGLAIGATLAP